MTVNVRGYDYLTIFHVSCAILLFVGQRTLESVAGEFYDELAVSLIFAVCGNSTGRTRAVGSCQYNYFFSRNLLRRSIACVHSAEPRREPERRIKDAG